MAFTQKSFLLCACQVKKFRCLLQLRAKNLITSFKQGNTPENLTGDSVRFLWLKQRQNQVES